MELLRFTVRNQNLFGSKIRLVSDSIDYVEAVFDFRTEDWSGLSKWAHFSKDGVTYDVNLVDDKITGDMHLNLEVGTWGVKLHGTDSEGTTRVTTDTAYIVVESYGNTENENPLPEIPLTAAEQIDAKSQLALENSSSAGASAAEAVSIANSIKEMAENGEFDGADGATGATPQISIGTVSTLEPGSEAQVSIEGTAENPVFNMAIPRGEKGEDGVSVTEVVYTPGEADGGTNIVTIKLSNGTSYIYSVLNGEKGEDGATGGPGLVWRGEWDAETAYAGIQSYNGILQVCRDVVQYNGSAYVCIWNSTAPVKGVVPEGDTSGSWAILAEKGDSFEDADNVVERLSAVEADIADLKYVPIEISSFSHNASTRENGDTVSSVVLSWVLNKEPVSVTVEGNAAEAVQNGSYTINEEVTATRTFSMSATDEREATATKSATINFYDGIYYGTAAKPEAVDSEFILALNKILVSNKNRTVNVSGGDGLFFWYAYPASMGESAFVIDGFSYEFASETVSFTNAFGVAKDYLVYVSDNPMLSGKSITVKGV